MIMLSYSAGYLFLRRRGIKSRIVIFPDENHWILNHGNRCVHLRGIRDRADFISIA
jgi:dipeptidyl aminopeptidase/acylaminoacyl peptidase